MVLHVGIFTKRGTKHPENTHNTHTGSVLSSPHKDGKIKKKKINIFKTQKLKGRQVYLQR